MRIVKLALALFVTSILASCVSKPAPPIVDAKGNDMAMGSTAYLLTNLHSYQKITRFYSTNYQQPTLVPRCTEVTLKSVDEQDLIFTINGVEYTYRFSKIATPEGFDANIKKYFGSTCDNSAIKALSAVDQKGVKEGAPYVGMSKKGLIYAIGYPPQSETPSTELSTWKYWREKNATMVIEFNGDTVSRIVK